jgi:hypothetical protein
MNNIPRNIKDSLVSDHQKSITSDKRNNKRTSVALSEAAVTTVTSASTLCRSKELKLQKNYEFVIGIDEAGRGSISIYSPLCSPY